jgi:hypothetical protein
MSSISDLVDNSRPLDDNDIIVDFSRKLYNLAKQSETDRGVSLAALFDLAVTAVYVQKLSSNGWLYCRDANEASHEPKLFYPFVNACPRCALRNVFYFAPSRKPSSAVIGQASSTILTAFLDEHTKQATDGRCSVRVLGGTAVVDAIAIEGNKICLFEIKSAPLITFPVETSTEVMSVVNDIGEEESPAHYNVTLPPDFASDMSLIVSENLKIPLGSQSGENWPFTEIINFLSTEDNLKEFVKEWTTTYQRYSGALPKEKTFWLSNGCGQPPKSDGWPARRNGSGYESISDGKSSVGLDRTDDIKKGIYQVLKIGTHYKEFADKNNYEVYTALTSNIHAIKHHEDYLKEFEDMMWTIDSSDRTYIVDSNENHTVIETEGLYNLYDGLVTFTKGHFRDEWVKERFSF